MRGGTEAGAALPAALLLLACLASVTGWLIGHVRADGDLARTLADEREAAQVADGAVQVAALALGRVADWSGLGGLDVPLACGVAPGAVAPIDVVAETARVQAVEDTAARWGADTPRWRLAWTCHAAGVLGSWPPGTVAPAVGVWVADDVEGDGAPWVDSNQRIRVLGIGIGRSGARASREVSIARSGVGAPVTLLAWRTEQH